MGPLQVRFRGGGGSGRLATWGTLVLSSWHKLPLDRRAFIWSRPARGPGAGKLFIRGIVHASKFKSANKSN